jgi:hypothetical protein
VPQDDDIAVAGQAIAGVDHFTVRDGVDRFANVRGHIHALV